MRHRHKIWTLLPSMKKKTVPHKSTPQARALAQRLKQTVSGISAIGVSFLPVPSQSELLDLEAKILNGHPSPTAIALASKLFAARTATFAVPASTVTPRGTRSQTARRTTTMASRVSTAFTSTARNSSNGRILTCSTRLGRQRPFATVCNREGRVRPRADLKRFRKTCPKKLPTLCLKS